MIRSPNDPILFTVAWAAPDFHRTSFGSVVNNVGVTTSGVSGLDESDARSRVNA